MQVKDTLDIQLIAVTIFANALGLEFGTRNGKPIFRTATDSIVPFNNVVDLYNISVTISASVTTRDQVMSETLANIVNQKLGLHRKTGLTPHLVYDAYKHYRTLEAVKVKWSSKQKKYIVDSHMVKLNEACISHTLHAELFGSYLKNAPLAPFKG